MLETSVGVFVVLVTMTASVAPRQTSAGQTLTLSGEMLRGYEFTQRNLAEAAEKMPE